MRNRATGKPGGRLDCGMALDDDLKRARALLGDATAVAVLTGAGISAESGIPTFRDALTGLWENYRPEDLATPEAFLRDPKLVWDWYAWRREKVAQARPNPGHLALVQIEDECRERDVDFTLITQNVDGLHELAGTRRLVELHGNIRRVKCFDHGHAVKAWPEGEGVPKCPHCGSPLRPDVVWFGESLPPVALTQAIAAARSCEVFVCVGTSTVVEPAASLPFMALEEGAKVIEVNPVATPLTRRATIAIRGAAGEVLPQLL